MSQVQPEPTQSAEQGYASLGRRLDAPDLRSMLSTEELRRRPSRPPDYAAENQALIALARVMATLPEGILQRLADTALSLCNAHSAGLSLLEESDQKSNFHWRAIAGQWAPHLNGGTPRNFGPCGTVLDQNAAMVCSHPELDFPYWAPIKPVLEEGLLIPFYIKGEAVGTIWVVAHDTSRRFDAEDLRVMTNLGSFAAAAYQMWLSLNATQRIASIVESSDDAIVSKDLNGVIMSWNDGAKRLFGYSAEEAIGMPVTKLIPADHLDEEPQILGCIRRGERVDTYETVRRRRDGTLVDVSLTVSPVRDTEGKVIGASKIVRDITERKRAREQQRLIVAEMKHRIRNILATAQAIATQTLPSASDQEREAFVARLQALAKAQDLLSPELWHKTNLKTIVAQALEAFREKHGDRILIRGPDEIWLDANKSLMLAMALHELATNAVKYGSLSNGSGQVRVEWEHDLKANRAKLVWHECGGPRVQPPSHQGFGSRLIHNAMKGELDATVDFPPVGVVCTLEVALATGLTDEQAHS
jgi:PAS domain S-box-containing protein